MTVLWVLLVWTAVALLVAPLLGRFLSLNKPHDPSLFRPGFRCGAHRR